MSVRDLVILGCSSQQPTRLRNHGAYLFRLNGSGILVDPGEGTQRQFIFAGVAPTVVNYILISHFHGDHCLGVGSFLMRLNLDKVTHPIHVFYPASGKKYFDRLRYGTIYHETITVIEHPISEAGVVFQDENFTIEAEWLDHGTPNLGWRITEPDELKFDKEKLKAYGVKGPAVRDLEKEGSIVLNGKKVELSDVSWIRKGESFAVVLDTRPTPSILKLAKDARLLLSESTYLDSERALAKEYAHMTALQAATLAKEANAHELILTHFSARYLDLTPFEEEARTLFPNSHTADDLKIFPLPKLP